MVAAAKPHADMPNKPEVRLAHCSVGCNQVAECLDWGAHGLIAYGAHNQAIVYDPQAAAICACLAGHTARVNCVRWLPGTADGSLTLATGSADQSLGVWRVRLDDHSEPWQLVTRLQEHEGPVTSLAVQQLTDLSTLLISSAGDGQVCVWRCGKEGTWALQQKLSFGIQLQLCADLCQLPHSPGCLLMACGGVDGCVRMLLREPDGAEFRIACKLSGHQDWVRCVAFRTPDPGDHAGTLLLASASQDKNIRIWAVVPEELAGSPNTASAAVDPEQPMLPGAISRYAPKPRFQAGDSWHTAVLQSVLIGHEDWVHSVAWQPSAAAAPGQPLQQPCLLSASMDRTMMLWRPDAATGLWMSEESVGDAGASHLGYYSGRFSPADAGASIMANGYTGALHMWQRSESNGSSSSAGGWSDGRWVPRHASGGHYGAVMDICWGFGDTCLFSASHDQTVRVFSDGPGGGWYEVARPQVHGHDFSAIAVLPDRDAYASASEEKVVRIMAAPQVFFDTQHLLCGQQLQPADKGERALGGAVAALGLSQKAVHADDEQQDAGGGDGAFNYSSGSDLAPNPVPSASAEPPLEEHLCQNTLWPEIRKLFGHGNNLQALAACGPLLASAAESKTADLADIWLWDTQTWACRGRLAAHTLSVTQLAFSHDGRHLLSASRDRSFAVFRRRDDPQPGEAPFALLVKVAKAHQRMVLGAAWAPGDALFATASRDASVKLWTMSESGPSQKPCATLSLSATVTSVAFAPVSSTASDGSATWHLAAGTEDGLVQVWQIAETGGEAAGFPPVATSCVWQASPFDAHAGAVRRLAWRRRTDCMQLATCSDDHAVKLFEVVF